MKDNPTLGLYVSQVRAQSQSDDCVLSSLPMVIAIAKKYARYNDPEDLLDLIQVGNVGLLNAHQLHDVARGDFRTFALYHVRAAIRNHLRGSDYLSRQTREGEVKRPVDLKKERSYRPDYDLSLLVASRLLTQNQRDVLEKRLQGHTLQEIADQRGTTHQAVRCAERNAIGVLSND